MDPGHGTHQVDSGKVPVGSATLLVATHLWTKLSQSCAAMLLKGQG